MHQNKNKNQKVHIPVLLDEVLEYLGPQEGDSYLDLTAGYGGHAEAILARTDAPKGTVLVDRDPNAISHLSDTFSNGVDIRQQDFFGASEQLAAEAREFDIILADLGVSSVHLNEASRGFAINLNGPLDMRMDQSQPLSAETIVNNYSEEQLGEIIREYGEEPKARKIASLIVQRRPILSTSELAEVVAKAWPGRSQRHPATRTFQALRIAVNDELGQVERSLALWVQLLKPGGRLAVISFHSLEDRIVKRFLAENSGKRYDAVLKLMTKTPVTASPNEIAYNPRARSAKLRAAVKIKTEREATYANSG